jgi:hypothetical protein
MRDYKITYDIDRVTIVTAISAEKARVILRKTFPHARIKKTEIVKHESVKKII